MKEKRVRVSSERRAPRLNRKETPVRDVCSVMIVAGEPSGDAHGSRLVEALREGGDTSLSFFGAAGPRMREAGVEAIVRADELSVVGVAEIARALPMFLRTRRQLRKAALEKRPDVVVLIDFPDFNLKFAKWLKSHGFTVVYYISPQLWAWRKYRVKAVRKYVDLLLTILPFEKDWYSARGVNNVEYVGHPLANEVRPERTREQFFAENGLDTTKQLIALLPGSRHKEIVRILPVFLDAAVRLEAQRPGSQFVIAIGSDRNRADVEHAIANADAVPATLRVVIGQTYDALAASDAAAVTSGTATLETGLIGTPLVIVYRSSALNYFLLRPLISVEHYGLINLIAGRKIARELIQWQMTPKNIADEIDRLLDPGVNEEFRRSLKEAADKLGEEGASARAARAILRLVGRD